MLKGLQLLGSIVCCVLGTLIACVLLVHNWDSVNVVPVVRAQDSPVNQGKFVEIDPNTPFQSARVVKVTVGGQNVIPGAFNRHKGPSGVPFQAGEDWIKTMVFTVKNRSTKTIVYMQWSVNFPETASTDGTLTGMIGDNVSQGRLPEIVAYSKDGVKLRTGGPPPLDFGSGQMMDVSLADYADDLRTKIEQQQPFSTITRCFINVYVAYFDDGMAWNLGDTYQVPDPSHPGLFNHLDPYWRESLISPESRD